MIHLRTNKGSQSADSIGPLAKWLEEMQPSSVWIAQGLIETGVNVDYPASSDDLADLLRRAMREEEADRLDLTVQDNIYLSLLDARPLVYVRFDVGAAVLVTGDIERPLADAETLESLLPTPAVAIEHGLGFVHFLPDVQMAYLLADLTDATEELEEAQRRLEQAKIAKAQALEWTQQYIDEHWTLLQIKAARQQMIAAAPEGHCCACEKRSWEGGCINCGAPCL